MKAKSTMYALAGAVLIGSGTLWAEARPPNRSRAAERPCQFVPSELYPLAGQEAEDVVFMREEEKLARDVYRTMYELWQHSAFAKISQAEQRHMEAVGRLIAYYGLEDPVTDDSVGSFSNGTWEELFTTLVQAGSVSIAESFKTAALIEEMDIVDLREALSRTDNPNLLRVFANLQRASRNHLRTFAGLIKAAGETYEAQYLTQEEFDEIAASPMERGLGWGHAPVRSIQGRRGAQPRVAYPEGRDGNRLRLRDRSCRE